MKQLLVASALAGVALASVLAWTFRAEVASAAEPPPPVARESSAELVAAAVRGCAEAGGRASTGIQDGVVVSRCQPAALPHLGVVEVRR